MQPYKNLQIMQTHNKKEVFRGERESGFVKHRGDNGRKSL